MTEKETLEISIPKSLIDKLSSKYKKEGFDSLSEYVVYLLKEAISEGEEKEASKEDEEKVKERLRALGYLE